MKIGLILLAVLAATSAATAVNQKAAAQSATIDTLHALYCIGVTETRSEGQQAQISDAQQTSERLTGQAKTRQLSADEKSQLESAQNVVQRNTDRIRGLGRTSDRLRSYLMTRGMPLDQAKTPPDILAQVRQDVDGCDKEKQNNSAMFGKCTAECDDKGAACYLSCVETNAPPSCKKIWACSGSDFLPF